MSFPHTHGVMKRLLDKVKAIVFIPTKYRVYHNLVVNNPLKILIQNYRNYSIPVIDLTKVLTESAKKELSNDKYLFWRDDTHWNGDGIKIVTEYLSQELK